MKTISDLRALLSYHSIRRVPLAQAMRLHPKYIGAVLRGAEHCPADFADRVVTAVAAILAGRAILLAEQRKQEGGR
jgi:hypothetical protein